MKALNIKYTLLHRFKSVPHSLRKKFTRYFSILFVIGSMILFFILSKKSTVDTRQIVAEWHSSDANNSIPAYTLLDQKWMRVEIAFKYLTSLNSKSNSIQKQIAVNQVVQAQADMESQITSIAGQTNDADTRRFVQVYNALLNNNKSLLAATVTTVPKKIILSEVNSGDIKNMQPDAGTALLNNQLSEKNKEIENLQLQLQKLHSAASKTSVVRNNPADATIASLKNQLAQKNKEIEILKSKQQKESNAAPAQGAESVAMFNYKAKNVEELQKQVKFFDWALKDMARQNEVLKKENSDLKSGKVIYNQ